MIPWQLISLNIVSQLASIYSNHLSLLHILQSLTFEAINVIICIFDGLLLRVLCYFLINKWMNDTSTERVKNAILRCCCWCTDTKYLKGCHNVHFFLENCLGKWAFYHREAWRRGLRVVVVTIIVLKKKKAGIITALKEKCPPHHHKHIYLLFSIFVDHLEY